MKTCAVRASAAIFTILAFLFFSNDALWAQEAEQTGFNVWTGDLDGMKKRRLIRILVPYSKNIRFPFFITEVPKMANAKLDRFSI